MRRLRQRLNYLAYRGLARLVRHLPRALLEAVATGAGYAIAALWRSKRSLVRSNLRRVTGPGADEASLERLVTASFVSYARYWVDSARLGSMRWDEVEAVFTIDGFEALRLEMARGRGAIVVLPHVGSWETGGRWLAQQGYPMTTVGERLQPPELFDWFVAQRAALGLTVLAPGPDTIVRLLDTLRSGRIVGLVADRDLAGNGVEVDFFGEKTTLPAGPALVALRSGAPLLPAAIYQRPNGRYHACVLAPIPATRTGSLRRDVQRLTEKSARCMEELIRAAPEQWHLFQPNWPSDRQACP